jgi:multiple sugar transport system permease protein
MALCVQSQKRGRGLLFAAVLVPYGISEVVGVMGWRFLADPSFGILSRTLAMLGIHFDWTTDPNAALVLVMLISIWNHLPFSFVLIYAALVSVPKEMHEAAQVDGAGAWQRFWHVVLPFIVPAALLAIMFRYVFAFRMFSEVWLVTKGGPLRMTEVLGTYLYRTAFRYGDFGTASATGWIMVLVTMLLASFYIRAMYRGVFKRA